MKLNQDDKTRMPEAFEVLDWLRSKASVFSDTTEDGEWGKLRTVEHSIDCNIPSRMRLRMWYLNEAGYCNPKNPAIGNMCWLDGQTEYRINWTFGSYRSNQNRIHFCVTTFEYIDDVPADVLKYYNGEVN